MAAGMKLDVHIVTCGRLPLLRDCCTSLARYLPKEAGVTIIINGAQPETENWLQSFGHPAFRWETIEREHRAIARNRAFDSSDADVIYFLDDDVVIPGPIFENALCLFALDPDLGVVGGPNLTLPESDWNENFFGSIMTSAFAAPMVRQRYGSHAEDILPASEHSLILCNLAVRTAAIPRWLRFRGELKSNEENLFLYECRRSKILSRSSYSLAVYHRRRRDLRSFGLQIFSYGFGRAQQTWFAPQSCHPAFFAPAALCITLPLLLFTPHPLPSLSFLMSLYFLLSLGGAVLSSQIRTLGPVAVVCAAFLTLYVHVSYGLGFLLGMFDSFKRPLQSELR
jgi:Glycosyl transferase family 2